MAAVEPRNTDDARAHTAYTNSPAFSSSRSVSAVAI